MWSRNTGSLVADECHLKFTPACVALSYFKLKAVHGYGLWVPESTETALCSCQLHSGSSHNWVDCFLFYYSRPLSLGEDSGGEVSASLHNTDPQSAPSTGWRTVSLDLVKPHLRCSCEDNRGSFVLRPLTSGLTLEADLRMPFRVSDFILKFLFCMGI